jgi:hypothetical protein
MLRRRRNARWVRPTESANRPIDASTEVGIANRSIAVGGLPTLFRVQKSGLSSSPM